MFTNSYQMKIMTTELKQNKVILDICVNWFIPIEVRSQEENYNRGA